jgi:hypothetical protein
MIRLVEVQNKDTSIEVSVEITDRAYNIVSGLMSDDARPYPVSEKVMIWLDPAGFLGEVEAIYPPITTTSPCRYGEKLQKQEGFPQFEVITCDNEGIIQPLDDGFIIWWAREKIIDLEIEFKNLQFLFTQEELVAIVAHGASIIE